MSDPQNSRDDMVELQSKMAFIEDTLRQLDVRMAEHQSQIDRLEVWCRTLAKRVRETDTDGANGRGGHEPPPHY
jgi:uncharacterized coiled-coil protein SlyX